MDPIKEYQSLKVFEGRDFPVGGPRLPSGYYLKALKEFLTDDEITEMIDEFESKEWIQIIGDSRQIMLQPKGQNHFDKTYFREQAYDRVNSILHKLENRHDGIDTKHGRYPRITEITENLLEKNDLIEYLSYQKQFSLVKLTEEGYKALEAGGILPYLKMKENWEQEELIKAGILAKDNGQRLFGEGSYFDAYAYIRGIITKATRSVTLVDNHVDERTLTLLSDLDRSIDIRLVTTQQYTQKQSFQLAVAHFRTQHGSLQLSMTRIFHDRFLVIDEVGFYVIGASVMDAGKKVFMIVKIEDPDYHLAITQRIANSLIV